MAKPVNRPPAKLLKALEQLNLGEAGMPSRLRVEFDWQGTQLPSHRLWDHATTRPVEASCFLLNRYAQVLDTVWYKRLRTRDDRIRYIDTDPSQGKLSWGHDMIDIDLGHMSSQIECLVFTVTSYDSKHLRQTRSLACRISDRDEGLIAQLEPTRHTFAQTGVIVAMLKRHHRAWMLTSIDQFAVGRTPEALARHLESLLSYSY